MCSRGEPFIKAVIEHEVKCSRQRHCKIRCTAGSIESSFVITTICCRVVLSAGTARSLKTYVCPAKRTLAELGEALYLILPISVIEAPAFHL